MYIGMTNMVLAQRLRKHMTDAMAGVGHALLDRIMLAVDMSGWGIAVLEYVDNEWWSGVRERDWWFTLKRWAVNNVAPGVGQGPDQRPNRWLSQDVLRLLKEMKQAQDDSDYPRVAAMRAELTELSQTVNLPLVFGASIVVPNLTPRQKTHIYTTNLKAWEKQAVKRVVRVVRSSPRTVQTVFSKAAAQREWSTTRSPCTCHKHIATARQYGHLVDTERHVALIPIRLKDDQGRPLRPRDPLPVPCTVSKKATEQGLKSFARMVKGRELHAKALSSIRFPEKGSLLFRVKGVAKSICAILLFEWFMREGGYHPTSQTLSDYMTTTVSNIVRLNCPQNAKAKITRLHLIGKAKSMWAGKGWHWRPIAASPNPAITKSKLKVCARAFTRMLRYVVAEIPGSFMRLWFRTWRPGSTGAGNMD